MLPQQQKRAVNTSMAVIQSCSHHRSASKAGEGHRAARADPRFQPYSQGWLHGCVTGAVTQVSALRGPLVLGVKCSEVMVLKYLTITSKFVFHKKSSMGQWRICAGAGAPACVCSSLTLAPGLPRMALCCQLLRPGALGGLPLGNLC